MDVFVIEGGASLQGAVDVGGSKNASLPQMAAALLTDEPVTLLEAPRLADISSMMKLLKELGCEVTDSDSAIPDRPVARGTARHLRIRSADWTKTHARYDLVRTMRASVCVLGPLLARRGEARVAMPGGCSIGDRPVDLHLRGLAALGAQINLESGDIVATAPGRGPGRPGRLIGARLFLGGPFGSTVLGTANVLCAATLAQGQTVIDAAACEPEIVDLANLLVQMGARIQGAGTPRIIIEGVRELGGAEQRVMPDRIEAGTYMMAAGVTRSRLTIRNCPLDEMMAVTNLLEQTGLEIVFDKESEGGSADSSRQRATCVVSAGGPPSPVQATTQPYPGFPTDLQAQLMAMLCMATGNSVMTEKIYPERFLHVAELSRMGAMLIRQGQTVVVSGVASLIGAPVMASDLRASAGLVLAGLAARGTTVIHRVYHLDRGYEAMEHALASLGASIRRVDDRELHSDMAQASLAAQAS